VELGIDITPTADGFILSRALGSKIGLGDRLGGAPVHHVYRPLPELKCNTAKDRVKVVTRMIDPGMGKDQIFSHLTQYWIGRCGETRLFLGRAEKEIGGVKESMGQKSADMICKVEISNLTLQAPSHDLMMFKIL
jgi:hypothetical protein